LKHGTGSFHSSRYREFAGNAPKKGLLEKKSQKKENTGNLKGSR